MQNIQPDVGILRKAEVRLGRLGFEKNARIFPLLFEKKHSDYFECISFDFGSNRGFDGCDIKSFLHNSYIEQKYRNAFPKKNSSRFHGLMPSFVFFEKFLESIEDAEENHRNLDDYFREHDRLFRERVVGLLDDSFFYDLVSSEEKLADVCERYHLLFDKSLLRRPCFRLILAEKNRDSVDQVFDDEMKRLDYPDQQKNFREFYSNLSSKK